MGFDPIGSFGDFLMGDSGDINYSANEQVGNPQRARNVNDNARRKVDAQFQSTLGQTRDAPQMTAAGIDPTGMQQGVDLSMDTRGQQQALADQMQAAAMGQGVSPAEIQQRQGMEEGFRQQLAMANSARGGSGAALAGMRGAQQQGAQMAGQLAQNQAILRAQEQAQARGMLGQQLGQMRGVDMDQAGMGLQLATSQAGLDQQAGLANQGATLQARGMDDARDLGMGGMALQFGQQDISTVQDNAALQLQRDLGVAGIDSGIAAQQAANDSANRIPGLGAIGGVAQSYMGQGGE